MLWYCMHNNTLETCMPYLSQFVSPLSVVMDWMAIHEMTE